MKFHLQAPTGNVLTGFGPGWVRIGTQEYRENVVLTAERIGTGFAAHGFDALEEADYATLLTDSPEIVLLGTGEKQRFPKPSLLRTLIDARVGIEVMDTRAACRTFNILVAEGRRVTAALIVV
jgi:uncharacterized protein